MEGYLLDVLEAGGIVDDPRTSHFRCASRTDKGVSALGNAVAFDSDIHPRETISCVNRQADNVWLHGYASVPPGFNPRQATWRWYRYHLKKGIDVGRLEKAAGLFLGTHDFGSFSRGEGGKCYVAFIDCQDTGRWIALDVRADRFLWGMMRRMVGSLILHAKGKLSLVDIEEALEGKELRIEPVPSETLWLMDVDYDFEFTPFRGRGVLNDVQTKEDICDVEAAFLAELRRKLAEPEG